MTKTISILGCGWLGLPLAIALKAEGFKVNGSTTTADKLPVLQAAGIGAYQIMLPVSPADGESYADFFQADVLILAVPPSGKYAGELSFTERLHTLLPALRQVNHLIFLSSTSVYPDTLSLATEPTVTLPEQAANTDLAKAEELLQQGHPNVTILRLGGLMGYNRIPGKYFAGKKGLTTGQIPVNFIHRDDVIGIISALIEKGIQGEVFNICAPKHPVRKEVYLLNAKQFGMVAPEFDETCPTPSFKIVDTTKLTQLLGYDFIYPNPLDFTYTA